MRCTVAGLTPTLAAMVRTDQWVWPFGFSWVVSRTISATCSSVIVGLRPRPFLTLPHSVRPWSANWARQARTVIPVTSYRAAITEFATPSAAASSTRARVTSR